MGGRLSRNSRYSNSESFEENMSEKKGTSTSMSVFSICDLPDEILLSVLSWLPGSDIIKNCALVNKHWNDLTKQQRLWHDKCLRTGYYNPEYMSFRPADFKRYFFKNPYTRNLIKNSSAKDGKKYWKVEENGGNGIACEMKPCGCHPVRNYNVDVNGDIGCWATSYGWCTKSQLIDLLEEGCDGDILDRIRPDVEISEWFAARFDCGIEYKLEVFLLDQNKQKLDSIEFHETKTAGRDWYHVEHTFNSYPPGLRYILYRHRGKDTQFWAGNYGAKITLSSVKFNFKNK